MSYAEGLRAEINVAIDMAERVQAASLMFEQAIKDLQAAVLLLDLHADNTYSRSCARMTPLIGRNLFEDNEIIGQVKSNLQEWMPQV